MFSVSFAFRTRVKAGEKMRALEKGNNRNDKSVWKEKDFDHADFPINDGMFRAAGRFQVAYLKWRPQYQQTSHQQNDSARI